MKNERQDERNDERQPAGPPSDRTRVRRNAKRGRYDRAVIEEILDEAPVIHVAFQDGGQPFVLPMSFVRLGGEVYLHGASANRMLDLAAGGKGGGEGGGGAPLCATATVLDGLVLARSWFHHSMNYRSVVILGRARDVTDAAEKARVLAALIERLVPGRGPLARPPTAAELTATRVLALPIDEASAKVRTGPPIDDAADRAWPVWAGTIPLALRPGPAVADGAGGAGPPARIWAGAVPPLPAAGAAPVESSHGDYLISDDRSRLDLDRVTGWLAGSYWAPGIPRATVERAAHGSTLVAGAFTGAGEQVGYLRAVSDGVRFAYLMDVFVAVPHRARGLGRALVHFALHHPDLRDVRRWLLGTRDAHGVYAPHGFGPLAAPERWMERNLP